MALSITHSAIVGVTILIARISVRAPLLPTVSISHAVLSTSSHAFSILTLHSAIQSWMTPSRPGASRTPCGWRPGYT